MAQTTVTETKLADYIAPQFVIHTTYLTFDLEPSKTKVKNVMQIERLNNSAILELDGENLTLLSVFIDGKQLGTTDYLLSTNQLIIPCEKDNFTLEINTEINPQDNTRLEGLYLSSGNYCTQCEAEGFRAITYYLDRPDVLSLFTTKVIGYKQDNKVLLSNGNLVESGNLDDGKHYAIWQDPFKKPCYLFALVAGNLEVIEDTFLSADNREIALKIYVQKNNIDKCEHAMRSLKKSMQWDEERFGLIYDLDIYMIVAVDDFNMGAMENKGLNVFNSKFVLARADSATDADFEGIEAVIGHEYFHNWTGNRVTCKNWFQLTLKEGLTVFRDQEFTADMLSPAVKRIEDVKRLRNNQFPEDAGPMSHPIQPQSYIEVNNFYTMTVYEKGAEVVRLYHTLLGEEGFQKGMKLYFQRFDGQAVSVEDFRNAMADANHKDLSQMHNWYVQAGTPRVSVQQKYEADKKRLTLTFSQSLLEEQKHLALLIPVKLALLSANGNEVLATTEHAQCRKQGASWLFEMKELNETLVFNQVENPVVLSLFRGFSAPVIVDYDSTESDLKILATKDSDSFVRWESGQKLALNNMLSNYSALLKKQEMQFSDSYIEVIASVFSDDSLDNALKALALSLPDEQYFIETLVAQGLKIDIDLVIAVQEFMKQSFANQFNAELISVYESLDNSEPYIYEKKAIANRSLKNCCLNYISLLNQDYAQQQFSKQLHMSDVSAALVALKPFSSTVAQTCLHEFYQKWSDDLLVIDKWFAFQASSMPLKKVMELVKHADFSYTNPNRVRSVLGVMARLNLKAFHQEDGAGYEFLASEVLKLNKINPQVAARLVGAFSAWRDLDPKRQGLIKTQLKRILATKDLSKDVYEIVAKSIN